MLKVRLRKAGVEAQGQVEDAGSQPCPVCEELFQNKWRDGSPAKASHLRQHAVDFIRNLLCLWICGMVVLKVADVFELMALLKTCVWKRFEVVVARLRARGLAMTYSNVPICKLKKCGECHQVLSASDLKDHTCPGGGASSGPGAVAVPGGMPAAGLQGANQPAQAELHQQMLTLRLQCIRQLKAQQSPLPQKRPGSTCSEHSRSRRKQTGQLAQQQVAGVEATPMPPTTRPQCAAVGAAVDGWHLIGLGSDSGCLESGSCNDSLTECTPPPLPPPHPAQGRQLSYAASWPMFLPQPGQPRIRPSPLPAGRGVTAAPAPVVAAAAASGTAPGSLTQCRMPYYSSYARAAPDGEMATSPEPSAAGNESDTASQYGHGHGSCHGNYRTATPAIDGSLSGGGGFPASLWQRLNRVPPFGPELITPGQVALTASSPEGRQSSAGYTDVSEGAAGSCARGQPSPAATPPYHGSTARGWASVGSEVTSGEGRSPSPFFSTDTPEEAMQIWQYWTQQAQYNHHHHIHGHQWQCMKPTPHLGVMGRAKRVLPFLHEQQSYGCAAPRPPPPWAVHPFVPGFPAAAGFGPPPTFYPVAHTMALNQPLLPTQPVPLMPLPVPPDMLSPGEQQRMLHSQQHLLQQQQHEQQQQQQSLQQQQLHLQPSDLPGPGPEEDDSADLELFLFELIGDDLGLK